MVKIYDGDDLVRTITASTPTATYTAAQQTTDFGSNQTSISATVQQIGDAVDGYVSSFATAPAPSVRAISGLDVAQINDLPDYEPGDVLLLICECTDAVIAAPSGWESVPSSPQATAGVSRLSVFWKYAGIGEANPATSANGDDHLFTRIMSIKDAQIIGSPFDASSGAAQTGTAYTVPGLTTNVNNCLVLDIASLGADFNLGAFFSGWTNASLTGFVELFDLSENNAGGGALAAAAGVKGVAGAVSATTVTTGADSGGVIKLALRPR